MIERITNSQWIVVIITVKIVLIGTLTAAANNFGSNKALMFFWSLYPVVVIGNLLVWLVVRGFAPRLSKRWLVVIIGLAIAFWPLSQVLVK